MFKNIKKLSAINRILFFGAILFTFWLVINVAIYVVEKASLETKVLSADDFQQVGIIKNDDGSYISTDADPQLILDVNMKISRVSIEVEFSVNPGEMLVYYSQKEGQGFAARKRFWLYKTGAENVYSGKTTLKKVKSLRIDPTTFAGNTMRIHRIIINSPQSFLDYFKVSFADIFNWILLSCLFSAAIDVLKDLQFTKNNDKL